MWKENTIRRISENPKKGKVFASIQLSTTEFLEKRDTEREKSFRKEKPVDLRRLSKVLILQKGMLVITGIHLSAPFIKKGTCRLGFWCAFKHTEKSDGKPKRRKSSVVVATTLDHTQAEEELTSLKLIAEGDLVHGVRSSDVLGSQTDVWKSARRSNFWESYNKVDKAIEVRTLCRSSNSEVVQILLTLSWNLLFKKYGICTGTPSKSEEPLFRHVKNFFRRSRTSQEKVVASRPDCEHEGRGFIVDSGASLHLMSMNELGKKILSEDQKKVPSSRPPAARQSRRRKRQFS